MSIVNIGSGPNASDGDPLRTAFDNINKAFANVSTIGPNGAASYSDSRFATVLTPELYGAIGDGISRPLSTLYGSLAAAQAVYPDATALTDELDWAALQKAIGVVQVLGGIILLGANRTYTINRSLTISYGVTIEGSGCIPLYGDRSVYGSDVYPTQAPYLSGTVLLQTGSGQHGIVITAVGTGVHLRNFGVCFANTIKFSSTGHGVFCNPPAYTSSGQTSQNNGLSGFTWQSVYVYGHDGNHYAFSLCNAQLGTIGDLQGWGGGGLEWRTNTHVGYYGNSVLTNPYFCTITAGSAHGYWFHADRPGHGTILMTLVRPQSFMLDTGGPVGITGPSNAQANILCDDNCQWFTIVGPDMEFTNYAHPVTYPSNTSGSFITPGGTNNRLDGICGGAMLFANNSKYYGGTLMGDAITGAGGYSKWQVSNGPGVIYDAITVGQTIVGGPAQMVAHLPLVLGPNSSFAHPWSIQAVDYEIKPGERLVADLRSGVRTFYPPPYNIVVGTYFELADGFGLAASTTLKIAHTTQPINGGTADYVISTNNGGVRFVYVGGTVGWLATSFGVSGGGTFGFTGFIYSPSSGGTPQAATLGNFLVALSGGTGNFNLSGYTLGLTASQIPGLSASVTGLRKSAGAGSTDVAATGADVAGVLNGQNVTLGATQVGSLTLLGSNNATLNSSYLSTSGFYGIYVYGLNIYASGGGLNLQGSLAASLPGTPVGEYTISTLPAASGYSGKETRVSNPAAGKSYGVRSNGTNWLYFADQSATGV